MLFITWLVSLIFSSPSLFQHCSTILYSCIIPIQQFPFLNTKIIDWRSCCIFLEYKIWFCIFSPLFRKNTYFYGFGVLLVMFDRVNLTVKSLNTHKDGITPRESYIQIIFAPKFDVLYVDLLVATHLHTSNAHRNHHSCEKIHTTLISKYFNI